MTSDSGDAELRRRPRDVDDRTADAGSHGRRPDRAGSCGRRWRTHVAPPGRRAKSSTRVGRASPSRSDRYHGGMEPPSTPQSGPRRDGGRPASSIADLLLVAGGLVLAFPLWSGVLHVLAAEPAHRRLRAARGPSSARPSRVAVRGRPKRTGCPRSRGPAARPLYADDLEPGDPVGRLIIPRIGLNASCSRAWGAGLARPRRPTRSC